MKGPIPPRERLIVALDVTDAASARALVATIGDAACFYKIGLELFMAGGYFELIDWLVERQNKVFVDLKFFDIPETVGRAVKRLSEREITFATVHGNDAIMRAAAKAKKGVGILAVTALTSLDRGDLADLGFQCDVEQLVLSRARRALEYGCDGVVASGLEVRKVRSTLGEGLLIVTPGIRPVENDLDQKRVVSPYSALASGADYIVVGRPIHTAQDPRLAVLDIQKEIQRGVVAQLDSRS